MSEKGKAPDFLIHEPGDSVGVAVKDLDPGELRGYYLVGDHVIELTGASEVPLGHKIALTDLAEGEDVIEYGVRVGVTTEAVSKGSYIHVHNVRSARWLNSVA